jgi:Na+-transporting NADH:ubiquinone oxidoreductase subunit NqrD
MSIKCRLLIAAVATMVSFNAYAETGDQLLTICSAQNAATNARDAAFVFGCTTYVTGVADTLWTIGRVCIPQGVSVGQI